LFNTYSKSTTPGVDFEDTLCFFAFLLDLGLGSLIGRAGNLLSS
jgi:hypothetical protein